jgi:hypothetical protein
MIRGPWAEAIISIASHSQAQKVKDTSTSEKTAVADSEPPPQYSFVRGRNNVPSHKQGR